MKGGLKSPSRSSQNGDRVVATWNDAGIPQQADYEAPKKSRQEDFPALPAKMVENPPELLGALRDAAETADSEAVRYATHCVRLEGSKGRVAATDGRQILVQSGFELPFDEDLLIPANKVFGCRELPSDAAVSIGKTDDWVTFRVGAWTFHFAIDKGGRFPNVDTYLLDADAALARCRLSDSDAEFLTAAIARLPSQDDTNLPVTLELNGAVAIRAIGPGQSQPTELLLSGSQATGQAMRINSNRNYLRRAVQLGFRELCAYKPEAPIVCHDARRSFVWAVLEKDAAIKPTKDAVRLESADAAPAKASPKRPAKRRTAAPPAPKSSKPAAKTSAKRKAATMPSAKTNRNGHAVNDTPPKTDQDGIDVLIEQAEAVKASLRDATANLGQLIAALKRHKKQAKLVQTTLASLRRLQTQEP